MDDYNEWIEYAAAEVGWESHAEWGRDQRSAEAIAQATTSPDHFVRVIERKVRVWDWAETA